ncbi:MAG: methyl-accepting chemotaxis protein [Firmicutes bacterium]|nr:methyl-accepting chemotaxis protein [Bacillota bacterium]
MKWFLNLKTAAKLITGFIIVALFIGVVGLIGIRNMQKINESGKAINNDGLVPMEILTTIQKNLLKARSDMLIIAYSGSASDFSQAQADLESITEEDQRLEKEYAGTGLTPEEKQLWSEFEGHISQYRSLREKVIGFARENKREEAILAYKEISGVIDETEGTLDKLINLLKKRAGEINAASEVLYARSVKSMIFLAGLGFLLAIIFGVVISQVITRPLKQGVAFAEAVGAGDLSQKIDLDTKDELGALAQALNNAVQNVRNLIAEVMDNAGSLSASSQQLSATVEEISAQTQNINARAQEIAAGTEETSASTEEMSASGQEIVKAISQLARKAEEGSLTAKEIESRAGEMKKGAEESREIARSLYGEKQASILKAIEEGKVVAEIGKMAGVISEIASQTNLLALNAAIEAARAGEQGRGFAVVAEEVRKLAEQSAATVSSIQTVIRQVQEAFRNLSENAGELLKFIDEKVTSDYEVLVQTGIQYQQDAGLVAGLVSDFAAATQQMMASIEQVNRAIEAVAASAEQAASGSQEISLSVTETAKAIEEVARVAQEQAGLAQRLNAMVQQFRT